jgi:anti-sigma-K factor RskA
MTSARSVRLIVAALALGCATAVADTPAEAPEVVSVIAQGADVGTVAAAVHEVGGTVTRELRIIQAVAVDVTPAQERALAEHSAVERVWRDGTVHAQDPEEGR